MSEKVSPMEIAVGIYRQRKANGLAGDAYLISAMVEAIGLDRALSAEAREEEKPAELPFDLTDFSCTECATRFLRAWRWHHCCGELKGRTR